MVKLDRASFALSLNGSVKGAISLARRSTDLYTHAQIDLERFPSTWTPWGNDPYRRDFEEVYLPEIIDRHLHKSLSILVDAYEALVSLNDRWETLLAAYFAIDRPREFDERLLLRQKMEDHRREFGPTWVIEPEIQTLVQETEKVTNRIEALGPAVLDQLKLVYADVLADLVDVGDQRAKDLIDGSRGVRNHDEAVAMLEKALSYGETGLQATKAYFELAMRYEDNGETDKAIDHYTKAMVATEPFSLAYFWRGRLYFQQGKWDEARHDLQAVVEIPVEEGGVGSPEYEEALEYLAKLDELTGGS